MRWNVDFTVPAPFGGGGGAGSSLAPTDCSYWKPTSGGPVSFPPTAERTVLLAGSPRDMPRMAPASGSLMRKLISLAPASFLDEPCAMLNIMAGLAYWPILPESDGNGASLNSRPRISQLCGVKPLS